MNQMNQYIFNIYHFILNVRDTMEYTMERENQPHSAKLFENRKAVLTNNLQDNSAFGSFLKNNGEKGDELRKQVQEFIDDYYGPDQHILTVTGETVRVDHTQNIKIFEGVNKMSNILRDILAQYMMSAKQQQQSEALLEDLVVLDERMFRIVFPMLAMKDFEKSFGEFQKVMQESQGKPTPQSNYIVQNELQVLSTMIRESRSHTRITDNETLDLLDDVNKVLEMTEGRRDRRDNKSFKDLFDEINKRLGEATNKAEQAWKAKYEAAVKEMIEAQQAAQAEKAQA